MCCPGCQWPMWGAVPRPVPLTTMTSLPSAAIADGYQPTGILPASTSFPVAPETADVDAERSNTATALLSASATNSRVASGESASAFGVLPSPVAAGEASLSVVITRWLRVSMTFTLSVLPDATKSRAPSGLSSTADGCLATRILVPSPRVPFARGGRADTVHPFHADTYTVPSGAATTPYGYRSVAILCTTRRDAMSTTASESPRFSAA